MISPVLATSQKVEVKHNREGGHSIEEIVDPDALLPQLFEKLPVAQGAFEASNGTQAGHGKGIPGAPTLRVAGTLVPQPQPQKPIGYIVKATSWLGGKLYTAETFHEIKDPEFLKVVNEIRDKHSAYPNASIDFVNNILVPVDGKNPIELTADEVKEANKLLEFFKQQFSGMNVESPEVVPHSRGNMLAGPSLVAPSDRIRKLKKITADDFIKCQLFTQRLSSNTRQGQICQLEKFLNQKKKDLDLIISNQRDKTKAASGPKHEEEQRYLDALIQIQEEFQNCDRFAMYYAIASADGENADFISEDASKKLNKSIAELELFIDPNNKDQGRVRRAGRVIASEVAAVVSKLPGLSEIKFEGDLTEEEKCYCHDVALLCARNRVEYITLCQCAGFPLKKDPIEWPLVRPYLRGDALSGAVINDFVEHPIFKAMRGRLTLELWDMVNRPSTPPVVGAAPPSS